MEEYKIETAATRRKASRMSAMFFAGPVNWSWLAKAGGLPGKAFQVAVALRHQGKLEKQNKISFGNTFLKQMNINRDAKRRALAELEGAGLISVQRETGKNPVVTIIEQRNK